MLGQIFRESGGAFYHLKALRYSSSWNIFRESIAEFLNRWNPPCEELLLLGPSAGYSLPTAWLKHFKKITAIDLDPLAPLIFRRRHSGVAVEFKAQDLFWLKDELSVENVRALLAQNPKAAVLFCNVIGQVLLEGEATDEQWFEFLSQLRQTLNGRHWASYHDTYSQQRGFVIDHMTSGNWTQGLEISEMEWPLTKTNHHRIQAVINRP
jgi:hypothetical protein